MSIRVTALSRHCGAKITGVDLANPVVPGVATEIEAAINRYAVLVFPDQVLTDEQQIAFSRLLGPLEIAPYFVGEKRRRLQHRELEDISNLDPDGNQLALDDLRRLYNLGNQLWHTDSSFKHKPDNRCTMHRGRPYDEAKYRRDMHRGRAHEPQESPKDPRKRPAMPALSIKLPFAPRFRAAPDRRCTCR